METALALIIYLHSSIKDLNFDIRTSILIFAFKLAYICLLKRILVEFGNTVPFAFVRSILDQSQKLICIANLLNKKFNLLFVANLWFKKNQWKHQFYWILAKKKVPIKELRCFEILQYSFKFLYSIYIIFI